MLVYSYFDDDYAMDVAWKQHDVYGEALGVIVRRCNELARFSVTVLEDRAHKAWGSIESFDHRTLQTAHDLLAAAWRFKEEFQPPKLPFRGLENPIPTERLWLGWLRQEVATWLDRPRWVRSVQLILTNQNQPLGYVEENRLSLGIMERFSRVPWHKGLHDAIRKDFASRLEQIQQEP